MSLMSGTSNRYFVINRDSMPQERSPIPDGRIDAIEAGMTESEWTSSVLGYRVIKAFNNIMTYSLVHGGLPKGSKNRITLSLAGDDIKAKQLVIALLDNMGFDGLDVGPLAESWRQQPGMPAYCVDLTLKQMALLLKRADRIKAVGNRDKAMKIMAKLPPGFPPWELVRAARLLAGIDALKPRSWVAMLRLGLAILRP